MPQPSAAERADRVAGTLFGGAIGDALGAAYEFVPDEAIERHLGSAFAYDFERAVAGSLLEGREAALPTDDTAMALSLAATLASGEPPTAELVAARFLTDLERGRGRFSVMFWEGGPGGATTQALRRLRHGADPKTNGQPEDGGNGAAMRAHPVGCLRDRAEVLRVAALQARVTHGHPAAVAAAQAVAVLVYDAIAGAPPSTDVPAGIEDATFVAAWREAHRDLVRGKRLPRHLRNAAMSGWATVAAAHAVTVVYANDPERAIAAAAASGGDTDTIACIAGAIAGARHGKSALPQRWVDGLSYEASRACDELATALASATVH